MDKNVRKINIIASLEFGAVYTGLKLCSLIGTLVSLFGVSVIFSIFAIIQDISFLAGMIAFFICAIGLLIVLIINHHNLKLIKLWKEDAILCTAKTKILGSSCIYSGGVSLLTAKISVIFYCQGKLIKKESGTKKSTGIKLFNGYSKIFMRFSDREIQILYSPKYDQVMILKDK